MLIKKFDIIKLILIVVAHTDISLGFNLIMSNIYLYIKYDMCTFQIFKHSFNYLFSFYPFFFNHIFYITFYSALQMIDGKKLEALYLVIGALRNWFFSQVLFKQISPAPPQYLFSICPKVFHSHVQQQCTKEKQIKKVFPQF